MFKSAAHLPGDLNRLTRETGMLLATVDSLTDDELAAPSKCGGGRAPMWLPTWH
jgi:maleylpyruvate isomerase